MASAPKSSIFDLNTAMIRAWILLSLCFCLTGMAQSQELTNSRLISFEDDLPGSWVSCMAEDSLGFLWIGTNGGLVRYDGSRMKVYRYSPDKESISSNQINDILIVGDTLWCAHNNGISRLDLVDNSVKNYAFEIHNENFKDRSENDAARVVLQARDRTIWAGLRWDGMVRWDAIRDTFIRVRPPAAMVKPYYDSRWSADLISSVVEDRTEDGVLWIGTMVGLLRLDSGAETFRFYRWELDDKGEETNLNSFRRVTQLPDGRICWGTWHTGTHVMDRDGSSYGRLENTEGDEGILQSTVTELIVLGDSTLWVSTIQGVCSYDLRDERLDKVLRDNYADDEIYRFEFLDKDGRVYGFGHDGISVYDPLLQQFKGYSFASQQPEIRGMVFDAFYHEPTGEYLVCARGEGFYRFQRSQNKWEPIDFPLEIDKGLTSNLRRSFRDEDLYIAQIGEHLYFYNAHTRSLTGEHYKVDIPTGVIVDIAEDTQNVIWLATNRDGIMQLDRTNGELRKFDTPGAQTAAAGERGVFYVDSQGHVWIKKRQLIHVYDPANDDLHSFEENLKLPFIKTFAEVDGYMYFTSYGNLLKVPVNAYRTTDPDTVELPTSFPSVTAGRDGILWGSSGKSLHRYDPRSGKLDVYDFQYGDEPTELFNITVTDYDDLILGDLERIIIVDPHVLRGNSIRPAPYVSKIRIGEKEIEPGIRGTHVQPLRLKHQENSFSLDFSSISHVMASKNSFRYRLVGLQDDWAKLDGVQTVNFNKVPSGRYTFELMAANNEGVWNEDVYELPILIATPWYATLLAQVVAVLAVGLIVILVYRYRVDQVREQERMRTKYERQLADVEMSALRAQMNPHFIFNCLNSIENFIVRNDTIKASSYLNDFARLIRLILQNSREKFIPLREEVEALELYLQLESLRFTNKFEYEINIDPGVNLNDLEVPPMVIQPYVENAIWHGLIPKGEPGRITINISVQDGILSCAIEDNGIGRKRSAEIKSNRKHDKPKSMGMSITSERVEILNRLYNTNTTIDIIDKENPDGSPAGTLVELNVPVE